jgi:hypothetical protein
MKYLLPLILILTTQLLTKQVIIDLDDKGRQGSAFIQQLKEVPEHKFTNIQKGEDLKLKYTPNSDIKFALKETTSFSTNIASLSISTPDNKPLEYSLAIGPSEDFLMLNFPEKKIDSDIKCTYSHGKFTAITSEPTALTTFKKEQAFGKYVLRLDESGKLAVGLIKGYNLLADDDKETEEAKSAFNQLEGLMIKNIFIQEKLKDAGYLLVILEENNKLITFSYSNLSNTLEIKKLEEVELVELYIWMEVKNIYFMEDKGYMVFLHDSFFKITKNGLEEWESQFFETLEFEGKPLELKDIQAVMVEASGSYFACILLKNTGLIFILINEEVNVYTTFRHRYITNIEVSTVSWDALNIAVFINNNNDENVNEFFIELLVDISTPSNLNPIYLNRALISSNEVKATQTDWQGKVTIFHIEKNVYIVPRSLFRVNTMPVYIYKGVNSEKTTFGFLHINDSREDSTIMFRLISEGKEQIVTLYRKQEDREQYTCSFNTKGQYLVKVMKGYLSLTLDQIIQREFNYSLKIKNPGDKDPDDKDDDDKDDKDKEKDKGKEKDDKKKEVSNILFIVLIAAGSAVAVILLVGIGLYIRYKRRQHAATLLAAGQYQAVDQP